MLLASVALASCLPITEARITARDLAQADARFRAVPASETVGFAPEPGARRTFTALELEKLATRFSIAGHGYEEVCFEVPVRLVSTEDVRSSMRNVLPASADLEIVEMPEVKAPSGTLSFPLNSLEPAATDGVRTWRGFVQYAQTRKVNLAVRVRVTERVLATVALRDIPANTLIPPSAVTEETRSLPLGKDGVAQEVAGKVAKQFIKAGAVVQASSLEEASVVKRGESVKVEVFSGTARLSFDAIAERQGKDGEWIELRNPASSKLFRARLIGSKAVIRL